MMHRLFFMLAALSVFNLLASIECEIVTAENGRVEIVCRDNSGESSVPTNNIPYMSQEACEQIKNLSVSALNGALGSLQDAEANLSYTGDDISEASMYLYELKTLVISSRNDLETVGLYTNLLDYCMQIETKLQSSMQNLNQSLSSVRSAIPPIRSGISTVTSYSCSSGVCGSNGDGTYSCPCTTEFQSILDRMDSSRQLLLQANGYLTQVNSQLEIQNSVITQIVEIVENIGNRLDAPDDRIWGEIRDIYQTGITNVDSMLNFSLNLEEIFYKIRELIRGQGELDSSEKLKLTTEGAIALNQLAFDIANFKVNQEVGDYIHSAYVGFTNDVLRLFRQWKDVSAFVFTPAPSDKQHTNIYLAMTNNSRNAFSRYELLANRKLGGATNWFQRIEYYHQAQLGWFDALLGDSNFQDEQNRLTESGLEQSALDTTNDLGRVTSGASNVVKRVDNAVKGVVRDFAAVEIEASLPTLITFFPEVEIFENASFGPIVWDTTDNHDSIELARRITSLVWRISFWVLYIGVAVGIGRLIFFLVLYVIHFVKDL